MPKKHLLFTTIVAVLLMPGAWAQDTPPPAGTDALPTQATPGQVAPGLAQPAVGTPFERGLAAYRANDLPTAVREMTQATNNAPRDSEAQRWLGFLLVRANQPGEAVPHLERAIALIDAEQSRQKAKSAVVAGRAKLADTCLNLGNALLTRSRRTSADTKRAVALFTRATRLEPAAAAPFVNLGYAQTEAGNYTEAIGSYRTAIRRDPKGPGAWRAWSGLGFCLQRMGRVADAAGAYQSATELNPQDAALWRNLSSLLLQRGSSERRAAISALEMANRLEPQNYATANQLARAYAEGGQLQEAAILFGQAAALPDAKNASATLYFNQGVVLAKMGKLAEAEAAYQKALTSEPRYFDALVNSGFVQYKAGNLEEAQNRFKAASVVNPASPLVWTNLGVVALQRKDTDGAIAAWQAVCRLDPKNYNARNLLANLLAEQNKVDEAIPVYQQMAKLRGQSAYPLNALGLLYQKQDNIQNAQQAFMEAVRREPRNALAHNNLGVVYEKRNRLADAVREYKTAVALDANFGDARANLSRFDRAATAAIQTKVNSVPSRRREMVVPVAAKVVAKAAPTRKGTAAPKSVVKPAPKRAVKPVPVKTVAKPVPAKSVSVKPVGKPSVAPAKKPRPAPKTGTVSIVEVTGRKRRAKQQATKPGNAKPTDKAKPAPKAEPAKAKSSPSQ